MNMIMNTIRALIWYAVCSCVRAQYPPPVSNVTTLRSPVNSNVTMKYKSPLVGTCTTVFPTQKQFTGYVNLPPNTLGEIQQNYNVNTFFWFIEARANANKAPLTIWINGGPGSSSMIGLFQESGPCEVIEVAKDKLGTQPREWGWDRSSNMLFIDQPNFAGLSYDEATNGTYSLLTDTISSSTGFTTSSDPTSLRGTFNSDNPNKTANTTEIAAHTIWHMLQGFLGAFPQYNPGASPNSTTGTVGVNLFAESYGGKYGPAFASHWEEQNEGRRNGSLPANSTLEIKLESLAIINGCVDDLVQGRFYPIFAHNNTYGIEAIDRLDAEQAASDYLSEDGCQKSIEKCRAAAAAKDLEGFGDDQFVNEICSKATSTCDSSGLLPYQSANRDYYDITQEIPTGFPPSYYIDYLNKADVQQAIGTPVNFSQSSVTVNLAFRNTGDHERGYQISDMAYLLSQGVRVALIYGDRDFICNWLGGEAVSFAVAAQSEKFSPFYSAGYADIRTNDSYVGGVVRQYGNLSFSRIYDAGHLVPAYQPETAFVVAHRIITGADIATGETVDLNTFSTKGEANATHMNEVPAKYPPACFTRSLRDSCSEEQFQAFRDGKGVVINGVFYDKEEDWKEPPASALESAGVPGSLLKSASPTSGGPSPSPTTADQTSVFVASATLSSSSSSAGGAMPTAVAANLARWAAPVAMAALAL